MTKLNDFTQGTPALSDSLLAFNANSEMKVTLNDLYWSMVPESVRRALGSGFGPSA